MLAAHKGPLPNYVYIARVTLNPTFSTTCSLSPWAATHTGAATRVRVASSPHLLPRQAEQGQHELLHPLLSVSSRRAKLAWAGWQAAGLLRISHSPCSLCLCLCSICRISALKSQRSIRKNATSRCLSVRYTLFFWSHMDLWSVTCVVLGALPRCVFFSIFSCFWIDWRSYRSIL
jgi:hypothetical protein